jgi:alkylation response protein AidB-like acyl-CoA dehydrogenase
VPFGDTAGLLIVTATTETGTRLLLVEPDQPGVTRVGYRTIDGRRAAQVRFDNASATALGEATDGLAVLRASLPLAVAAYAAEALGLMEVALDTTVGYLRSRRQFGASLSTFQVLKHRAADMYVSIELARSTVQWAAMSLASSHPDPTAASRAKLQTGLAGRHVSQEAIQLHGGIGLTDEYTLSHVAARLTTLEHVMGDVRHHRDLLARTLRDHTTVDILT